MANLKITELSATTAPVITDIVPIVTDISTTPVTKKVTVKDLLNTRRLFSIVPAANFSLTAGSSAQNAFPTTGDVFTVEASTTYLMDGKYYITKSGTTCTIALNFLLGGSASLTSIHYIAVTNNADVNLTGATHGSIWVNSETAVVIGATSSSSAYIQFSGMIRTNVGGTITPQITFSATPTSPVMVADSYLKLEKIGTSTENTLGAVA